jgi:alcohol dehydrogenase
VRAAAMTVRPHGTVVLMGGIGTDLHLPYRHLMRNCITIRGNGCTPATPHPGSSNLRLLLSLHDPEISTFPLADADHDAANGGPFKMTVITP